MRLQLSIDDLQLVHQLFVDGQSARGVENDNRIFRFASLGDRVLTNLDRVGRAFFGVNRYANGLTDHMQLLDRCRALEVSRHQHRVDVVAHQQLGKFAASRRFPGTLQATHHDDGDTLLQVQRIHPPDPADRSALG